MFSKFAGKLGNIIYMKYIMYIINFETYKFS